MRKKTFQRNGERRSRMLSKKPRARNIRRVIARMNLSFAHGLQCLCMEHGDHLRGIVNR